MLRGLPACLQLQLVESGGRQGVDGGGGQWSHGEGAGMWDGDVRCGEGGVERKIHTHVQ